MLFKCIAVCPPDSDAIFFSRIPQVFLNKSHQRRKMPAHTIKSFWQAPSACYSTIAILMRQPYTVQHPCQYHTRHLIVRLHKVLKPPDQWLKFSNYFVIWQASRQHCCRDACQIAKQCKHFNTWSLVREQIQFLKQLLLGLILALLMLWITGQLFDSYLLVVYTTKSCCRMVNFDSTLNTVQLPHR